MNTIDLLSQIRALRAEIATASDTEILALTELLSEMTEALDELDRGIN